MFVTSSRKYSSLLPLATEYLRKNIAISIVFIYTAYREVFIKFKHKFPIKLENYIYASKFFNICKALLAEGKLEPHLREEQVSRKKLIYSV
jgi:hypothetical protein